MKTLSLGPDLLVKIETFSVTSRVAIGIDSGDNSVLERDLNQIPIHLSIRLDRRPLLPMTGG